MRDDDVLGEVPGARVRGPRDRTDSGAHGRQPTGVRSMTWTYEPHRAREGSKKSPGRRRYSARAMPVIEVVISKRGGPDVLRLVEPCPSRLPGRRGESRPQASPSPTCSCARACTLARLDRRCPGYGVVGTIDALGRGRWVRGRAAWPR
jgi:hypothetical protein